MLSAPRRYFRLSYLFISFDILLLLVPLFNGEITFFFAGVFLGILLILLYVYARVSIVYVRVHRSHSNSAVEGEEFFIDTAVANFSYLPIFYLQIQDTCLPSRTLVTTRTLPVTLLPRSVYEYTGYVYITKKMGTYTLGPVTVAVTDPLGIFSVRRDIDYITDLIVYPSLNIPERLSLMEYPYLKKVGEEIISIAGYSADFRGPREYRKEDPKKTIHWRATAKYRKLMVKEFEENAVADVGIFIDYRRISLRGTGNLTTLAMALNTGASIAAAASKKYHRFGVSFIGFRNEDDMLFNTGVSHLHLILHSMVSLTKLGKFSDYCSESREKLSRLKRNSTAVFIVSQTTVNPEAFIDLVASCRIRRIKSIVILINDRTFIKVYPEQMEFERSAVPFKSFEKVLEAEGASVFILSKRDIPAEKIDASADIYKQTVNIQARRQQEAVENI